MPEQLCLVVRNDFLNDVYSLDLLPWRARDAWEMSLGDGYTPIEEALTIHVPGDSDDALAINIQALDALIVRISHLLEINDSYSVWLRHQLAGETNPRQALVIVARRDKARVTDVMIKEHYLRDYVLGLTRSGAWESVDYEERYTGALESVGGMVSVGNVAGDMPARLARVTLISTQSSSTPLSDVWLGFRSNRIGIGARFAPLWEAELGHPDSAMGAVVTDAEDDTASGGQEFAISETHAAPTEGVFSIDQPRVKPGSITITTEIDGVTYEFSDHHPPFEGLLETWWNTVADESLVISENLTQPMPTPGSIHFKVDGVEFAADDGEGVLIRLAGPQFDTFGISGEGEPPATRTVSFFPITPGTITGRVVLGMDDRAYQDDGAGGLWFGESDPVGTIDYTTGQIEFWYGVGAGAMITMSYVSTALGTAGTIDYLTGAWTLADLPAGTLTVDYNYGYFSITFNYRAGAGGFNQPYIFESLGTLDVEYTGYHNRCVRVTFGDATMQPRWWMRLSEAAEFPHEQHGNMQVLGRFKLSDDATICRVRLDSGFDGTTQYHRRGKVEVKGDAWALYPLGHISIDSSGVAPINSLSPGKLRLRLSADRLEGTGTLDMDCLILIPLDEGYIHIEAHSDLINLVGTNLWPVVVAESADGRKSAMGLSESGESYYSDIAVQLTGGLPNGTDIYVIAAAQRNQSLSDIADGLMVKLETYSRWMTLRGVA